MSRGQGVDDPFPISGFFLLVLESHQWVHHLRNFSFEMKSKTEVNHKKNNESLLKIL